MILAFDVSGVVDSTATLITSLGGLGGLGAFITAIVALRRTRAKPETAAQTPTPPPAVATEPAGDQQ